MTYALVIGQNGGGKSGVVREVAQALGARGLRVAGFTQRTYKEAEGRSAIEITRLNGGATLLLARTSVEPGAAPAVCSFAFDPAVIAEARRWVEEEAAGAEVLVLDGLGKLELGGGGHRATLDYALAAGPLVLLALREDHLAQALQVFPLDEPVASFAQAGDAAAFALFLDAVEQAAREQA